MMYVEFDEVPLTGHALLTASQAYVPEQMVLRGLAVEVRGLTTPDQTRELLERASVSLYEAPAMIEALEANRAPAAETNAADSSGADSNAESSTDSKTEAQPPASGG